MWEDPARVLRNIIFTFLILIAVKYTLGGASFQDKDHKGKGFSVKKIPGWQMVLNDNNAGIFVSDPVESGSVTFLSAEKDPATQLPLARISVYEAKMATPAWIDDVFPEVMEALASSQAKIVDQGELKIDEQIGNWVLYSMKGSKDLNLEFYVTDEKNGIFKIRYAVEDKSFAKYRPVFEDFRESFLFSKALF